MTRVKHEDDLTKTRQQIAAKVRELRKSRKWTQAELSRLLGLSQNRLSEIERGGGSFSAEQFLRILKLFNVPTAYFASGNRAHALELQNALARHGAVHLQENSDVLPSEQLENLNTVVREALVDGSPRIVAALAPVLVQNAERINWPKLHADLAEAALDRRLAWVVENTLTALERLQRSSPRQWTKKYRHAEIPLRNILGFVSERLSQAGPVPLDILDATIRSKRTLDEVRRSGSAISSRWGIATSVQVEDFLQAMRAALAEH